MLPLYSTIRAGFSSPIVDSTQYDIDLQTFLIENPHTTFTYKMKGDAMLGEGLLDGDFILVQKGAPYAEGDIILAAVDGELMVRYFMKDEHGNITLQTSDGMGIYPQESFVIQGVVVGSFRKYS